ncbi:MAG: two-component system response regulator [Hyphomicrobiales bacterium]|nr:MAG: two-component system response regulator [Hyphomicrobiales bacterium]
MQVIMVVDDSPVIRKVADRLLRDMGFIVVEAGDGNEALNLCGHKMPDAILVDWSLPSMSGTEFIQEFRSLDGAQKVKILYCTSEIMVAEMTRAKRAGANGFLMKPFDRNILSTKLQEIGMEAKPKAA